MSEAAGDLFRVATTAADVGAKAVDTTLKVGMPVLKGLVTMLAFSAKAANHGVHAIIVKKNLGIVKKLTMAEISSGFFVNEQNMEQVKGLLKKYGIRWQALEHIETKNIFTVAEDGTTIPDVDVKRFFTVFVKQEDISKLKTLVELHGDKIFPLSKYIDEKSVDEFVIEEANGDFTTADKKAIADLLKNEKFDKDTINAWKALIEKYGDKIEPFVPAATEKQLNYAEKLAKKDGVEVPKFKNMIEAWDWIAVHKERSKTVDKEDVSPENPDVSDTKAAYEAKSEFKDFLENKDVQKLLGKDFCTELLKILGADEIKREAEKAEKSTGAIDVTDLNDLKPEGNLSKDKTDKIKAERFEENFAKAQTKFKEAIEKGAEIIKDANKHIDIGISQ